MGHFHDLKEPSMLSFCIYCKTHLKSNSYQQFNPEMIFWATLSNYKNSSPKPVITAATEKNCSCWEKRPEIYHPGASGEFTCQRVRRHLILNMKMILIYIIIATPAMTAVAQGTLQPVNRSSECNLTEPGPQTCFGVLGEPLVFYLPTKPHMKTSFKKSTENILTLINDTLIRLNEKYKNRTIFFPNGTLKLEKATKHDSGEYNMETHSSTDGVLLHTVNIHLHILAPVSEPAVLQMCLSPQQMTVSCSSEGDEVEFTLFLDDNFLIKTQPSIAENRNISNVSISLHGQLLGKLMCIVQNNISREQTIIHLISCTGNISDHCIVTVAVVVSAVAILLILAVFLGIRKFKNTTGIMTVNEDEAEEDVVYSDIRLKQLARETRETPPISNQDES
ncbi:uncharacterized protein LOC120733804 isoform X2 [Simochromis diagramma]|uniref:uncharacterized protein LOC120733804 isoform X2 n=1 Tax=Simochromis diagramma TaxID=43689 RepID=UPI001A7E6500|nr:uncharacterized protein LOC120733804 isoform X2 [Simochromis diagramma]